VNREEKFWRRAFWAVFVIVSVLAWGAAIAALVLALSSCGSPAPASQGAPSAGTATSAAPAAIEARVIGIARQAGASQVAGSTDIDGIQYADGSFYGPGCTGSCSEQITVTWISSPGQIAQDSESVPSAHNAVIMGPGRQWYIKVYPVETDSGNTYFTSPQAIAARTGGTVVSG
jgi:hypothetical protein